MKKKILIFTPHFYPENQIINDLIYPLRSKYEFTVVTSFPHYPKRSIYKSYSIFKDSIDFKNKIKIIRLPLTPRVGKNLIFLSINYLSYLFLSIIMMPYLLLKKFDKIFIFQTSPITIALVPTLIGKLKNIKTSIWILDLWPETLHSFNFKFKKRVISFFDKFAKFIYENNDNILISSKGFSKIIERKGINRKKIFFIPQWVDSEQKDEKFIDYKYPEIPSNAFKITFAGNIGNAQDIESIIKAIDFCKSNNKIYWIFIGDGSQINLLKNYIKENKSKNILLLGSFPKKYMNFFFKKSDSLLISLKASKAFDCVLPAKLQSYMNSGKPILTMASGEVSRVIDEFNIGLTANSGDYKNLSKNIDKMMSLEEKYVNDIKYNSKKYLKNYFNRDYLISYIEKISFT